MMKTVFLMLCLVNRSLKKSFGLQATVKVMKWLPTKVEQVPFFKLYRMDDQFFNGPVGLVIESGG